MRGRNPSSELLSPAGIARLATQALMGAALALCFGLALIVSTPAVAELLTHSGSETVIVVICALTISFAIGATMTGAVFILAEDV